MAAVMAQPGHERSPSFTKSRRMHTKSPKVRSPKSVLLPESPESSTESSSLASSILGEQIVECTSFRSPKKEDNRKNSSEATFEEVDDYTWFVSLDQPSDLLVEVDDISFHLHKLPLLSRSGLLFRLASQSCDSRKAYINLVDVPGGAEAFSVVVKYCYGIIEELTPTNVATIRCVAEYLEMTEAFEEGNVVSRAEAYLNFVVLTSWQESIIVLQSCELLLPWAADMNLVKRCAESVADKACTDPRNIHWPYSDMEKDCSPSTAPRSTLEGTVSRVAPKDWWYEDVSHLTIYCFSEVIEALKLKYMTPDLLGGALEYYAQRWLPGLVKPEERTFLSNGTGTYSASVASTRRNSPICSPRKGGSLYNCSTKDMAEDSPTKLQESIADQNRNRFILEEIVSMLPKEKDVVSCSFLLRMTRAAYMLNCDVECKVDLERRAGLQLDQGNLGDLLIPCFSHTSEYLYDIDLVRRILDYFLTHESIDKAVAGSPRSCSGDKRSTRGIYDDSAVKPQPALNLRAKVAKLLDAYLAEVARDSKLPLIKFQSLAEALPEGSRLCDDGLYRAVDTYLKIHPTLTEHERKRLCRILNCHRLSLDACTHASQNERLPLRFVVQVLFCEQLKIRSTVTEVSNSVKEDRASAADNVSITSREPTGTEPQPIASTSAAIQENVNQMEIRALQRELAAMRAKYSAMERDQSTIQDQVEQISRITRTRNSSWSSGAWKKISKLHLFNSKDHKDGGDSSRIDESRPGNPRRWRNSIS
ncbi:root phototropism protein 3 isoform X2 [Physcomitrium patens]|uniref:NPH3 domain-containing protein n=1 Tax=Physcomitrium patens TaxID=3218 RepID=A0A2K1J913_PHYPA|nr:root phototropism protein 3-like isoform X2 [Physcomitrium patens]PNR38014.1 hypothetical protein PHYPA_021125 [Physcomitrium patens]|eukprot:XP_024398206.1 root phototropism protein 3-like isoform X2 [Physcomitrella patens]